MCGWAQVAAKPIVQTATRCTACFETVGLPKPHSAGFHTSVQFQLPCQGQSPSLQSPECAGPSFRPQTIMASQFRLEMCSLSVDLSAVLEPVAELRIHNIAMQPAHYTPSSPSTKHPPYYRTFATPTSQTHPASATSVDAPQSSCRRLLTHVIQSHCASLENPI